jgi:hypothetical protein
VRLTAEGVLGDVAMLCEGAREGRVTAERLRDELVARAVSVEVADFVLRWASMEFDLVAGSGLDNGE